jgi:hypothetical protein
MKTLTIKSLPVFALMSVSDLAALLVSTRYIAFTSLMHARGGK